MSIRIEYAAGSRSSTRQILDKLNEQYPDKIFTAGPADTIVESYREETLMGPQNREILLNDEEEMRELRAAKLGYGAAEAAWLS